MPQLQTPTQLIAAATNVITLHWQDNSNKEGGFAIERALSANGPWTEIKRVPFNITSYVDDTTAPNTTYFYRIKAII